MNNKIITFLILLITSQCGLSQKMPYIPNYLTDPNTVDGKQFTWSKTAESENFIVIWGNDAGLNPINAINPDLRFDPFIILDTMEWIYDKFVDFGFAIDTSGLSLNKYKIPVIMLNTFGSDGVTGWAFGGDVDGKIGAFWAHPLAMKGGHVAAHEFAHSLQSQTNIDHRLPNGLGFVWQNAGIFWETHANFLRNLLYPQDVSAWGMDLHHIETWGDWKNTYENYALLLAIHEIEGMEIINRMWRESHSDEYPLQAFKRLMGYSQTELNDVMYQYASRMANYDFNYNNLGQYFRQYRNSDLRNSLPALQATWTILDVDSAHTNHYKVPIHLAPEEYAYNVIPIYPDEDSCTVIFKFKGAIDANLHCGWRYGCVAVDASGAISRYGKMYSGDTQEFAFTLEEGESTMYVVIMGAPKNGITTNESNDTWHGYPKHFRFPYEMYISGGKPEGHQDSESFRQTWKTNGHYHPNGGGWVANSATVDANVYVGKYAMVLGNSTITENVRIVDMALVEDVVIKDNVVVSDNAFVFKGNYSGNAMIGGQAFVENVTMQDSAHVHMRARVSNYILRGNVEVGGDVIVYNNTGNCDNGVHYRMTNYYQDNLLECDGRDANHPDNEDVNNIHTPFNWQDLQAICNCTNYPGCLTSSTTETIPLYRFLVYPNPANNEIVVNLPLQENPNYEVIMYNVIGEQVFVHKYEGQETIHINVSTLPIGFYSLQLINENLQVQQAKLMIET